MSHVYHEGLEGYDPRQILHDGCPECEHRAESVERALGNMDAARFEKAWRRAYDQFSSQSENVDLGSRSKAEMPVVTALWAVAIQLERRGIPMSPTPPRLDWNDQLDEMMARVAADLLGPRAAVCQRMAGGVVRQLEAAGFSVEDQLAVADAAIHAFVSLPS